MCRSKLQDYILYFYRTGPRAGAKGKRQSSDNHVHGKLLPVFMELVGTMEVPARLLR